MFAFFNALKNYECHDDIDSEYDSEEETAEFFIYLNKNKNIMVVDWCDHIAKDLH